MKPRIVWLWIAISAWHLALAVTGLTAVVLAAALGEWSSVGWEFAGDHLLPGVICGYIAHLIYDNHRLRAAPADVAAQWMQINHGVCPKCMQRKFIGHGPLCTDCYLTTSPGAPS